KIACSRVRCSQCGENARTKDNSAEDRNTRAYALQRMIWLVSSAFPRVRNRTTTAMMISATIPIPTYSGLIKLIKPRFSGVGLGTGDAAGGGDAFFFVSIDCAYCKRWKVSLSCGLIFNTAS